MATQVLAHGLSFCPNEDLDKFKVIKDLQLFARKQIPKQLYSKELSKNPQLKPQEIQAIDSLISLLEENDRPELIDKIDLDNLFQLFAQSEQMVQTVTSNKNKSDKFPALNTKLTCDKIKY